MPEKAPNALMIVWLALFVLGVGAATMFGYQSLLSSHRIGRFHFHAPEQGAPNGRLRATSGASGDMAREQAELLAQARPAKR